MKFSVLVVHNSNSCESRENFHTICKYVKFEYNKYMEMRDADDVCAASQYVYTREYK